MIGKKNFPTLPCARDAETHIRMRAAARDSEKDSAKKETDEKFR